MKKKLWTATILTLSAVALVVCSVLATVAYLTASSGVSNVFTVGNVSITMFETKVNVNGEPVDPKVEVDANSYHLVPGKTYTKDPTIRITSLLEQDEMYLFVKSSNQIRKAEDGNNGGSNPTMRQQMKENGWVEFIVSGDGVEIVWVYGTRDEVTGEITPTPVNPTTVQNRKNNTPGPEGEIQLCYEFTIHANASVALYGAASVNFTAFAIQTSGIEGGTLGYWNAIKSTYPYDCGIVNPLNPYDKDADPYAPVPSVPAPTEPTP